MNDEILTEPGQMRNFPSVVIDASAGCGKTEELAKRMIGMMLCGAPPDSIITMTFTRAAAGEIYERLIQLLYRAADDEEKMHELFSDLNDMKLRNPGEEFAEDRDALLELLRQLIHAMNSLNISTLDSFMAKIIQSFPIELGLPGSCAMLDEATISSLRGSLIRELLIHNSNIEADQSFLDTVKEASYGETRKLIYDICADLVQKTDRFYDYRSERDAHLWSKFDKLPLADEEERTQACNQALLWLHRQTKPKSQKKLEAMFRAAEKAGPDTAFSREVSETLAAFFNVFEDFCAGVRKPAGFAAGYEYDPATRENIAVLVRHAAAIIVRQASKRSQGMRKMLEQYAHLYRRRVLDEGHLSFADLPRLLDAEESEAWLYDIGYRLNGRLKHWLIDEFQDTSRRQWHILQRIIDDTQDGEHSLFLVGDVKQAIYGWRDGDSRLMGEAQNKFALTQAFRTCSYRYGSDICGALNFLFSKEHLDHSAFSHAVAERWSSLWKEHKIPDKDKPGLFRVWQMLPPIDNETNSAARLIAEELQIVRPWERGLSAAILVRSKKDGPELKEAVRAFAPELAERMVWEGDESITSDPLVAALLALLVVLEHPGDKLAAQIVKMTPELAPELPDNAEIRRAMLLRRGMTGCHDFLHYILMRRMNEGVNLHSRNVNALLDAARMFDHTPNRGDALAFREYAEGFKRPDAAMEGKIRIMTIHHSKGLSIDMVFSWFKNSVKGSMRVPSFSDYLSPHAKDSGDVDYPAWLLYHPGAAGKVFAPIVNAAQEKLDEETLESLCVLYVALTRAKYGVYVILPPLSKKKNEMFHPDFKEEKTSKRAANPKPFTRTSIAESDESYYLSDFLFESLFDGTPEFAPDKPLPRVKIGGVETLTRYFGQPDYFQSLKTSKPVSVAPLSPIFPANARLRRRKSNPSLESATPAPKTSDMTKEAMPHGPLFRLPDAVSGSDLGIRIHAFMQQVEWLNEFNVNDLCGVDQDIANQIKICLNSPEVMQWMNRPDHPFDLWRERSFNIIIDETRWAVGCFDRAVLHFSADGTKLERADIIDFKSNEVDENTLPGLVEHYRMQMKQYRYAAAKLLDLPADAVTTVLIFTRIGRAVPVQWE